MFKHLFCFSDVKTLYFISTIFFRAFTFPPLPSSPPSPHERVRDVGLTATSTSGGKIVIGLGIEDVDEDVDEDDDVGEHEDDEKARACARCLADSYIKI